MTSERIDIRQHILDTGTPIILGKGFSAVGLNELLSAAAVPKGSFYHYFKSKEAFGEALLDSYFADYFSKLDAVLQRAGANAAERLMDYWQRWLETQSGDVPDGKCLAVKLGGEVCDLSEAMREALRRGTNQVIERIACCIAEGNVDGSLPLPLDAHATALALYQNWMGASLLTKIRRDRSALEVAMQVTSQLLGLKQTTR